MNLFYLLKTISRHPFNKRKPYLGICRFFKWQISNLFNKNPIIYPLTSNSKIVIKKGMHGATGNIYNGLLEYNDMLFVMHLLRADDYFIDIGANVGVYTVLASAEIGAYTLSIEPVPSTFAFLEMNVDINKIRNKVSLMNIAIGEKEEVLSFTSNFDAMNHVATNSEINNENILNVNVYTLDSIVENIPVVIKIDVEGYEYNVLKGAQKILNNSLLKAIIIELNGSGKKYGFDDIDIHNQFLNMGFQPYHYDPIGRNLTLLKRQNEYNTIYIRDLDFVKERLVNSRKIKVYEQFL
jgi:FkbM family methyltransferase